MGVLWAVEFMGLCCGGPILMAFAVAFTLLWRRGGMSSRTYFVVAGLVGAFVLLALLSEGRYVVLEEGVVTDACAGDAVGVRWRLDHGGSANASTDDGLGALECATTNGHVEAARVLLQHGADPDARNAAFGGTPREDAHQNPEMRRLFAKYPARREPGS